MVWGCEPSASLSAQPTTSMPSYASYAMSAAKDKNAYMLLFLLLFIHAISTFLYLWVKFFLLPPGTPIM